MSECDNFIRFFGSLRDDDHVQGGMDFALQNVESEREWGKFECVLFGLFRIPI